MSHHNTVSHPQLDITDLYIFRKSGDPTKTILIMNVNPSAPTNASTFDSETSYEFKLDTDGDAEADIAFHVWFSPAAHGEQTATIYLSVGTAAQGAGRTGAVIMRDAPVSFDSAVQITNAGEYRFYAGLRSDPWFVDVEGILSVPPQLTGRDFFGDANIFGIVLEVPNSVLSSPLGLWARTMAAGHHEDAPVDQIGRPVVAAVLLQTDEDKHLFLHTPPSQQRAIFLPKMVTTLQTVGYGEADATRLALQFIPDMQTYDFNQPPGHPNGRLLTDDLLDVMLALGTNGMLTTDNIGAHTDLLDEFPYLGAPHPLRSA